MPWTKSPTQTARFGVDDISGRFYVPTAGAGLHVEMIVVSDVSQGTITEAWHQRIADSSLTSTERTQLNALLAKLRDEGMAALGYTNV